MYLVIVNFFILFSQLLHSAAAKRRHRHKNGGRIPISNSLHKNYANSWRLWEESKRHKRQGAVSIIHFIYVKFLYLLGLYMFDLQTPDGIVEYIVVDC